MVETIYDNSSKVIIKSVPRFIQIKQYNIIGGKRSVQKMKQPAQDSNYSYNEQVPERNPQMRAKQSNYSMASEMSFNGEQKKQKSKSFNRRQGPVGEDSPSIVKIYRELQYTPQIRNALKKFCYLDKEKLLQLSINELRQICQRELKRIDFVRRNNVEVQRLLSEQEIDDTDNELSLIALSCQVKALAEFQNELGAKEMNGSQVLAKTRLRQYENILLEIQKSDQLIKSFINTHLKLPQPSDISISDCKKFFKKQAYQMSQSSDRIVLSRRTLCEIIIFLCRLLEGQILAFDDIYEYQDESFNSIELGDEYNRVVIQNRTVKNNQVIIQNLDQSFSDNNSQQSSTKNQNNNNYNKVNGKTYQSYSNDDLGKKVHELAGICEQIPQLEAFTRTLKFCKISLENRESFFKIVDVIIALHHKVGYLSRNKPTLLREIQHIEQDLTEVYESIRQFVASLLSEIPQFGQLRFKNEEDSKHQLTETLSYLRKDMKKLADIIIQQNKTLNQQQERLEFVRVIVQTFCQSIGEGDELIWQECVNRVNNRSSKNLAEDQTQIVHWLNDCYIAIFSEIKTGQKHPEQLETQRNLQAEVHTLLADYERLRAEHQELQGKYSNLLEHKDELIFDISERDKIISNLTSIKISAEKREKTLRDQLLQAQDDANRWEHDLSLLQEQLEVMSIQNQNKINDLLYEHQNQVKELVDKITGLERARMEMLSKYEEECNKSIRLLQDGNCNNVEIQTLKERLQKKIRQHDDTNKRQKETINNMQKQLQQLKNQKNLLENRLQMAEKNKKKLMEKLEQVNARYSENTKDFEQKYEQEIMSLKENIYRLEKELEKYKRNNNLLTEEVEQLKGEHAAQVKTSNQYRIKFIQLGNLQSEYDSLSKEYERLIDSHQKLESNNEAMRQKIFELTNKHEELLDVLGREKDLNKKLQRKSKDFEARTQEVIASYEGIEMELKEQQKLNKMLQKKISENQSEIQSLQDALKNKDKNHSILINKSQLKYQHLTQQLQEQIQSLRNTNKQLQISNEKTIKELKTLERQLRQQQENGQQKQAEWAKFRAQLEKKLNEKDELIGSVEEKNRQVEEQNYNQSILLNEIKQEKHSIELRLAEVENADQKQMNQMRKNITNMQLNQTKLKDKIQKLQNQLQSLRQQLQKLKLLVKEREHQLELTQQQNQRIRKQEESEERQRNHKDYQSRTQEITQLKEQILIEKNVIITENNKLQQENSSLQEEIAKLKSLNQALEKNVLKLQQASEQTQSQFSTGQFQLKQTISKHLFTISALENELTGLNAQRQMLRKDYEEVQQKLQAKCKQLADKDNLLFEKQLEKNNSDKLIKELKFKINELQSTIQTFNVTIDKLKNTKIKPLEQEIAELNALVIQLKRKEDQSKSGLNDLQSELQKVRKDAARKLEALKEQKVQVEEQYQNQIKKINAQFMVELSAGQLRARKQTENEFNQLLIKEKETLNNLTIQKMEELGEMQRKYQKLIKQERNEKNQIQDQCHRLEMELNQLKRSSSLNASRLINQETQTAALQQINRLKAECQALKRQLGRHQQENTRLAQQTSSARQENSTLLAKSLEAQHTVTILTSKLSLVTQNLQATKKSLQEMNKLQLEKINLERDLEKLKHKSATDQTRIYDYKQRLQQMEQRVTELEGTLQGWRNKEFEWTRNSNESAERFRILTNQSNDMSQKLQEMKLKLAEMTNKLTEKSQKLQTVQSQLQAAELKVKQKQIQLQSQQQKLQQQIATLQDQLNTKNQAQLTMERQHKQLLSEWEHKENEMKQDGQIKLRRVRELEFELNEYKKNLTEGNKLIEELSQAKSYSLELEDKNGRLDSELAKVKADKLQTERQNQMLKKQISSLTSDQSSQLIQLQQQNSSLLMQNKQLRDKIGELIEEIKKQKQQSLSDLKTLQQRLNVQFSAEKRRCVEIAEEAAMQLRADMKEQQVKRNEIMGRYNLLVKDLQENIKLVQLLRKQNMNLSDHCQKYEDKIRLLETEHKLKGEFKNQIQSQLNQLNHHNATLQYDKQSLENQVRQLKKQNSDLKQNIIQLQNQLLSRSNQIQQLQQQLTRLQQEVQRKEQLYMSLELRFTQTKKDLETTKTQHQSLTWQLSLVNQQKQQLQSFVNDFKQNATHLNSELDKIRTENTRLQHAVTQKTAQLEMITNQTQDSSQQLSQSLQQQQSLRKQNRILLEKFANAQKQLHVLANQFKLIQQKFIQAQGYIQWSDNQRRGLEEKLSHHINQTSKLQSELNALHTKLFESQGEKHKKQFQVKTLTTSNQTLSCRVIELENHLKDLQNQHQLNQLAKSTVESAQIQRLQAELALSRQEILRLHQVIKKKENDFEGEIVRLTEQKAGMWRDNQAMAQECHSLKVRLSEMERLYEAGGRDLQRQRHDNQSLVREIQRLRGQLQTKLRQISGLKQQLLELERNLVLSQNKAEQLARVIVNQQAEVNRISSQNEVLKSRLSSVSEQEQQLKLSQSKFNQRSKSMAEEIARLQSQLALVRLQYSRLHSEHTKLSEKLTQTTQDNSNLNSQLSRASSQIVSLKSILARLQTQNQNLSNMIVAKDKIIHDIKQNVNKGNQLMENADKQLKKAFEEKNKLSQNIKQLTIQKENYFQIIKTRESEITTLKQTIMILEKKVTELNGEIHKMHSELGDQSLLNQSRSSINLVTKSYSYQGGHVTVAELNRLQEENRRLIKEIQTRDKSIHKQQLQIQKLTKQVKLLKEQIQLLSEGKTINLKGYTRVTNPNDNTLNTKGVVYTEYDVKQLKAKIQLLQRNLARYQDRETELLKEIEKFKFRERHYIQRLRVLQENVKHGSSKEIDLLPEMGSLTSPVKKTSFDENHNNKLNPQSSTYRMQTGIEVTQRTINMTKKQVKTSEKYFLRVEGEELRKIIERLSNGQQIMSRKVDQILESSQKNNKDSLQLVLTSNQLNLSTAIVNEIRELIHQNKALVETLKSMKQYRDDVSLLLQEYIDPELVTEFVYRILTYFSEVEEQSPEALEIRQELNSIRKNNVGGYYFTVLESYTKYILQNNSIEIYKEELRQKARELISFREKFQALIDSKLDQNQKLLNKSQSRGSLIHRSRGKYMTSSRMGSSRGKSESEISREQHSRVKESMHNDANQRVTINGGQNVLPNPINLLNGAGQQLYGQNISVSPVLITANQIDRSRATSTLTYTPYNKQLIPQVSTPSQSANDSRIHVSYSSNSTNYMGNSYTTINSANTHAGRGSFEKK